MLIAARTTHSVDIPWIRGKCNGVLTVDSHSRSHVPSITTNDHQ